MAFDLDETWVLATEAQLGARLPASYRAAMMRRNGGSIEADDADWELHPILDKSDRKRLARSCNDILSETDSCRTWAGFPEQALAIAADGSGDRLVFLCQEEEVEPAVYRWMHATRTLRLLAADFGLL